MEVGSCVLVLLIVSLSLRPSPALEPISTSALLAGAASVAYYYFNCRFQECCTKDWIPLDVKGLEADLRRQLFGQHIAIDVIPKAIEGFLSNKNSRKSLTLSLHGWTGTGKNFVSRIIAESLYKNGVDSKYVHHFVTTFHFPTAEHTSKYKQQLQEWIHGNVSMCKRSLFIFDEMDKMPPELIDSIKPFLEYYNDLDGVSYRKAMFIFLSNAGGEKINEVVLNFWNRGMKRENIQRKDLENSLSLEVYNNKMSGFWHTSLIDQNLIDYFIPFLPLEYRHVVMCAKAEVQSRHFKDVDEVAIKVAEEMVYFPKEQRIFSTKGCKTVAAKVDYWTTAV
ncbi:torsin-1A-like isoform X1 [Carcharodon carcharias]|uniref:torsin-1A-like isoform X1 n=1 Tax=Carcharodon carcharias TaxID=13397 RepID=UPI001B7F6B5B|nr:torsin-1A-like isoform X1 [Carcharodon carcharias]